MIMNIIIHFSEIMGLCLMKWPSEIFKAAQNEK